MSKTKHSLPLFSEMHFVSSLSLEEAVHLIGQQASPEIPITMVEVDSDTFKFKLDDAGVDIHGTLRRWQGTFTRLDCRSDVEPETKRGQSVKLLFLFPTIYIIFVIILAPLMELNITLFQAMALFFVMFILCWIMFLNSLPVRKLNTHVSAAPNIRLRDQLLDKLIDTFQKYGQVSLDGTGLEEATNENPNFVIDELPQYKTQGK